MKYVDENHSRFMLRNKRWVLAPGRRNNKVDDTRALKASLAVLYQHFYFKSRVKKSKYSPNINKQNL